MTGTLADPGVLDSQTVTIDWGDGIPGNPDIGTIDLAAGVLVFRTSHLYQDNPAGQATGGAYTIAATATDKDGAIGSASTPVVVNNAPPVVGSLTLNTGTIDEAGTITLSSSFTDAGILDSHVVTVDWGDGTAGSPDIGTLDLAAGVSTFSLDHLFLDNPAGQATGGAYAIAATVTDNDGGAGSATASEVVNNVAPAVTSLLTNAGTINEGGTITLTGTFTDPGVLDTHGVAIDWGDGSVGSPDIGTLQVAAGVLTFSASHAYPDNPAGEAMGGSFAITATVTDKDGGAASQSTPEVVNNLPPAVTSLKLNTGTISEGGSVTLTGTFADPGIADTHAATIDWGDGTPGSPDIGTVTLAADVLTFSVSHTYRNNPAGVSSGHFAITATVTDKDGGSAVATTAETVANVAPTLATLTSSAVTAGKVGPGQPVTLTGTFSDPGILDSHSVVVSWGDSTTLYTVAVPVGATSFSLTHTYAAAGNFTIGAYVKDGDGGVSTTHTTKALIGSPPPIILGPPPPIIIAVPLSLPAALPLTVSAPVLLPAMTTPMVTLPPVAIAASSAIMPVPLVSTLAIEQPDPGDTIQLVKSSTIRISSQPPAAPATPAAASVLFDEQSGAWLPVTDASQNDAASAALFDDMGEPWLVIPAAMPGPHDALWASGDD